MSDLATALKWAREFGIGAQSPAQVLADALETAEEKIEFLRALRDQAIRERDAALAALRGAMWDDDDGPCCCAEPVEKTGRPHIERCLRARAVLAGSEPIEASA